MALLSTYPTSENRMSLSKLVKAAVAVQEAEKAVAESDARLDAHNATSIALTEEFHRVRAAAHPARRELVEAAKGA